VGIPQRKRKLSFKQARQLDALPARIEELEKEQTDIIAALSSPEFYAESDAARVALANARLEELQRELDDAYLLWEELEESADSTES